MAGPPSAAQQTLYNILAEIGRRLSAAASPRVEQASKSLAQALDVVVDVDEGQVYIEVPHFWALYLHDGRDPFQPRRSRSDGKPVTFLVWFANPSDDPRLAGGPPVRETDIQQLSKEQFAIGLEENTKRMKAGGSPFMYVLRRWPSPTPGKHFFTEPCASVVDEVPDVIAAEMTQLLENLGNDEADRRDMRANFKLR